MKTVKLFCAAALTAAVLSPVFADDAPQSPQQEGGRRRRPPMHQNGGDFAPSPFMRLYFTALTAQPELVKEAKEVLIIYKAGRTTENPEVKILLREEAAKRLAAIISKAAKDEKILSAIPEEYKGKLSAPAELAEELLQKADATENGDFSQEPFNHFCIFCAPAMMPSGNRMPPPGWNGGMRRPDRDGKAPGFRTAPDRGNRRFGRPADREQN